MNCAALDWDKTRKDYVPCSPKETVRRVRLQAIIAIEVELCDTHLRIFKDELEKFGGGLDKEGRVKIL